MAEVQKIREAEEERRFSENAREISETVRETNEAERIGAEEERDVAEGLRELSESGREAAEELRVIADRTRATFVPSVSPDGVLSWTNDKGLENPAPVSLIQGVIDTLPYAEGGEF
jgi:hypothetical protein